MTRAEIEALRSDAIGADSIRVSWGESEGWVAYAQVQCYGCSKWLTTNTRQYKEPHCEFDEESAQLPGCTLSGCHGDLGPCEQCTDSVGTEGVGVCGCEGAQCDTVIEPTEGPMMNFLYPCDLRDAEDAAAKIAHLPLCVVELDAGQTGFALTAGGTDLTWEICGAYVACGFLPPIAFANLAAYADCPLDGWRLDVFHAMRRSITCQQNWLENYTRHLDHLWKVSGGKKENDHADGPGES